MYDSVSSIIIRASAPTRFVDYAHAWGMICTEADTPSQALTLLREAAQLAQPFDVIILDSQVPGMDGLALAKVIKSDPHIASVKVIMFTSLAKRGDAKIAQDLGFSGYLVKPVRHAQLYACLKLVMGHARDASPGVSPARLVTRHQVAEAGGSESRRPGTGGGKTTLSTRSLPSGRLQNLGYKCDVAANGVEAIQALLSLPYDVVLMDCQMPELDGFQATLRIANARKRENYKRISRLLG